MGSPTLEVKEDLNQLKRWTVSTLFKRWVKEIGKATRVCLLASPSRAMGVGVVVSSRVETRRDVMCVRRGRPAVRVRARAHGAVRRDVLR